MNIEPILTHNLTADEGPGTYANELEAQEANVEYTNNEGGLFE